MNFKITSSSSMPKQPLEQEQVRSISYHKLPTGGGGSFSPEETEPLIQGGRVVEGLAAELKRVEVYRPSGELGKNEKAALAKLRTGARITSLATFVPAFAISCGVSMSALTVFAIGHIGFLAAGALGGAGFALWSSARFYESLKNNPNSFQGRHPGLAGMAAFALTVAFCVAITPPSVAIGAAMGFTAPFVMAQAVGFGAFKATLFVLENTVGKLISHSFQDAALKELNIEGETRKAKKDNLITKGTSSITAPEWEKNLNNCRRPASLALGDWWNNIVSPPIHSDLRQYITSDKKDYIGRATHLVERSFHRAFGQLMRFSEKEETTRDAFAKLTGLATANKFGNASEAWENFDQVTRKYSASLTPNSRMELKNRAKEAILNQYGPKPNIWEIISFGWCTGARAEKLKEMLGPRDQNGPSAKIGGEEFWTWPAGIPCPTWIGKAEKSD